MLDSIGVILDCDGVLLDSLDAWFEAEEYVCQGGRRALTQRDTDYVNTLTIVEAAHFFHEEFGVGESDEDVYAQIDAYMLNYYQERVQACAGALDFVRGIRAAGARITVVSSSPLRFLQPGLSQAGFSPYLDDILSADDMRTSKRERLIFDVARKTMGTAARNTWGFDDTAYALDTLADAGYRTVGIFSCDKNSTVAQLAQAAEFTFEAGFSQCTPARFQQMVRG